MQSDSLPVIKAPDQESPIETQSSVLNDSVALVEPPKKERAKATRKITPKDVKDIATLVAKRCTEAGACSMLGIVPRTWYNWKKSGKREGYFQELVERVREAKVQACVDTLQEAGTKVNPKTGYIDWRAHDRLLDRLDPQRFGPQPAQNNVSISLVNGLNNDALEVMRAAFERRSAPQPVVNCGVPAAVEDKHITLPVQTVEVVPVEEVKQ